MNMDVHEREGMPGYRWITIFTGGFLILLYLGFFVVIGLSASSLGFAAPRATQTPTSTSTPHILINVPMAGTPALLDLFSTGLGEWKLRWTTGKLQEVDGRLMLQGNMPGQMVLAENQGFIDPAPKYYVQADFMTDVSTAESYGLVFGSSEQTATFYLFAISPKYGQFGFSKYAQGAWEDLQKAKPTSLLPYPQKNSLSALFDKGRIRLYINGSLVLTQVDPSPLSSAGVGVWVSNPGFRLLVDNFYAYTEQ